MRRWAPVLFVLFTTAGCAAPEDPFPTTPAPSEPATFVPGIYFASPLAPDRSSHLVLLGQEQRYAHVRVDGIGFDLDARALVTTDGADVVLRSPDGQGRRVHAQGVSHLARASLADDRVLVQATTGEGRDGSPPQNFEIYVVDATSGKTQRLSDAPVNDESPEWVAATGRAAWTVFDPDAGLDVLIADATNASIIARIPDAGGIHLDVSQDGALLLEPGRMRIYDVSTGALKDDLRDEVLAGLRAAGFEPDERFPGQANRGTFPLDGAFSPDAHQIVFDGAVRHGDAYAVLLARVGLDGSGFEVLAGPLDIDPSFSNEHNFSQLNPTWLG